MKKGIKRVPFDATLPGKTVGTSQEAPIVADQAVTSGTTGGDSTQEMHDLTGRGSMGHAELPQQEETPATNEVQTDYRVVAVMFKLDENRRNGTTQLQGAIYGFRDRNGDRGNVAVVPFIDAAQKPDAGEIWVCEVDAMRPITNWIHKDTKTGRQTAWMRLVGNPICKIEVPDEIRFHDKTPDGRIHYAVREHLPDGKSRVIFAPDNRSENQPERGELWKVKPTTLIRTIGTGDNDNTIVIGVECLERVTQQATLPQAKAWANAAVWTPSRRPKVPVVATVS